MKNLLSILLLFSLCGAFASNVEISILSQNNTGPTGRSRPVLTCYPQYQDNFPKCFVASGGKFPSSAFPTEFFNDVWRMDIDLSTETVQWQQLAFDNAPIESKGLFHQFWQKNLTAFSFTAGLNDFDPNTFASTCNGDKIVTYDFVSQSYELHIPSGGGWHDMTGGACELFGDDVYCWGGFNCSTYADLKIWTKYNIPTNTLTFLNSAGMENLIARHHSSVNCNLDKICILGSGDRFGGGTIDQWNFYDIEDDTFIFFEPRNKPTNIQYISPDLIQTWDTSCGKINVIADKKKMLLVGGDNATGASGTSNTIRYLGEFNRNSLKFREKNTHCLFTIKQQYLRNLPKIRQDNYSCHYYVEFGGFEENINVPLHYPNAVVLYKYC